MTLDDLPLVARTFCLGDLRVAITAVDDQEALLRQAQNRDKLPFGLMLWESAVALADGIVGRDLHGVCVLDLGCGVGLPGVVAAMRGATVVATDYDPLALELTRRNAAANGVGDRLSYLLEDWNDWRPGPDYDLVLAADIVYDRDYHDVVARLLTTTVAPGGSFVLADPRRSDTRAFVERLKAAFGPFHETTRVTPDLITAGKSIEVDLLEGTRPVWQT